MIPAAFDYVRAGSSAEAIALIGEHGEDAKFLAGGMSLLTASSVSRNGTITSNAIAVMRSGRFSVMSATCGRG